MARNGWIKVADGLPHFGVTVLLTDGKDIRVGHRQKAEWLTTLGMKPWRFIATGVEGYEFWDFEEYPGGEHAVTHWKPLPPLPSLETP